MFIGINVCYLELAIAVGNMFYNQFIFYLFLHIDSQI